MPSGPKLRFAPSPNGYLHLGHAYSALLNEHVARRLGAALLLRIENIDTERCTPERERAVMEDLDWLGIRFDGPILRQSERQGAYRAALERLERLGMTYRCRCSRSDIARAAATAGDSALLRDPDGAIAYPGTCRHLGLGPEAADGPLALRLDLAKAAVRGARNGYAWSCFDPETGEPIPSAATHSPCWSDPVIARKDIGTSYHLAVTVDDADQGITHVVRGRDLEAATAIHACLQDLLGLPHPLYHHHDLILDVSGNKLAKSRSSQPLRELRGKGVTPHDIRLMLGFQ